MHRINGIATIILDIESNKSEAFRRICVPVYGDGGVSEFPEFRKEIFKLTLRHLQKQRKFIFKNILKFVLLAG